jgi:Anti-anti-sigma regulatory factor (antagonist of anti-sigma factor)
MVNINSENAKLVLTFPKKIDTAVCGTFENELNEKLKTSQADVIFDLSGVEYIASSFLRICVDVAKKTGKDNFLLKNVPPFVEKVLKVAGLEEQLNIG